MNLNSRNIGVGIFVALVAFPALAIDLAEGCTGTQAAVDKNVFNWRYYLQHHGDLLAAGYETPTQACAHWVSHGFNEGRQGHAGFHAIQYLSRYPDLATYYGASNYSAAAAHYVNSGISEWRIGYQENGMSLNRLTTTISNVYGNSKIFVGTSKRMAGAIDSLVYDNIEFINSYDHGRELQLASVSSWSSEAGLYNPTEAGSCQNWWTDSTSSILNGIYAAGPAMSTSVTPAFWFEPTPNVTPPLSCPGIGKGSGKVAWNHTFQKSITIGQPGLPNVIKFASQIDINEKVPQDYSNPMAPVVRFEVPTGYLAGEFSKKYRYNRTSGALTNITSLACHEANQACTSDDPLIFTNALESHALAVCNGPSSGAIFANYPKYESWGTWFAGRPILHTTKWAVLKYIKAEVYPGARVNFNTYISVARTEGGVGAVSKLKDTLTSLYQGGQCN